MTPSRNRSPDENTPDAPELNHTRTTEEKKA
jgi:hypothetical protein